MSTTPTAASLHDDCFLTVLPPEPGGLAEKDRATFDAIVVAVEAIPSVRDAREKFDAATDRSAKLKTAFFAMNKRGKVLTENLTVARAALEDGLIEQYAGSGAPVDGARLFTAFNVAAGEREALMRALARLAQHVTPLAEIAQLQGEADLYKLRSEELRRAAEERKVRTAELLREAAEFESGLTLDVRSTLTGFLLSYADSLLGRSVEASIAARQQETAYRRMNALEL